MKTTFGTITQPHIRTILAKNNTIVLALLMFYETKERILKSTQSFELCHLYNNQQLCLY